MLPLFLLPSLGLENRAQLPRKSGVYYAIARSGKVLYIGMAVNLHSRWNAKGTHQHHELEALRSVGGVRLRYRLVPEHRIRLVEALEIKRFDPPQNDVHPKSERCINVRIRLERFAVNALLAGGIVLVGSSLYANIKSQPTLTAPRWGHSPRGTQ